MTTLYFVFFPKRRIFCNVLFKGDSTPEVLYSLFPKLQPSNVYGDSRSNAFCLNVGGQMLPDLVDRSEANGRVVSKEGKRRRRRNKGKGRED